MKWPSGGAFAVAGAAFFLVVIIFVLPVLIPSGSATRVLPTNGVITPTPTNVAMITPTDYAYLPYIAEIWPATPTPTPSTPYIHRDRWKLAYGGKRRHCGQVGWQPSC